MSRGRTIAGAALAAAFALLGVVLLTRDRLAPKADPCVSVRSLANARARDVDTAMQAVRDNPPPRTEGPFPDRFGSAPYERAQQGARHAVARYAAVVAQNSGCFDTETKADADALARTWNVG